MLAVRQVISLLTISVLLPLVAALLSNVTVDDQNGDPTTGLQINYNPPAAWKKGQTCTDCSAVPSPVSDAYMGTWMDASFNPSGTGTNKVPGQIIQASLSFVGVAVYVNAILTTSSTLPNGNTDYTFYIDGDVKGVFQRAPTGEKIYTFNQTVFAITGLNNTLHQLSIEAGHSGKKSLVLLDSVIYTTDDGTSDPSTTSGINASATSSSSESSSKATPVGVIVGAIVAAIVPLGSILALFFYKSRQRKTLTNKANSSGPGSDICPVHRNMAEGEARPYSIGSGLEIERSCICSRNSTTTYPSSVNSPSILHSNTRLETVSSPMLSPSLRVESAGESSNSPYSPNRPNVAQQQMRAITELNESTSGSEVLSPPAYDDVGFRPSITSPSTFASRPLPTPRFKY